MDVENPPKLDNQIHPRFDIDFSLVLYCFEDDVPINVTVIGAWYQAMITNFLWNELQDMNTLCQQDDATCQIINPTIEPLQERFDNWIVWTGDVNWLFRSCHLTHFDYFIVNCSFCEALCYSKNT